MTLIPGFLNTKSKPEIKKIIKNYCLFRALVL